MDEDKLKGIYTKTQNPQERLRNYLTPLFTLFEVIKETEKRKDLGKEQKYDLIKECANISMTI